MFYENQESSFFLFNIGNIKIMKTPVGRVDDTSPRYWLFKIAKRNTLSPIYGIRCCKACWNSVRENVESVKQSKNVPQGRSEVTLTVETSQDTQDKFEVLLILSENVEM